MQQLFDRRAFANSCFLVLVVQCPLLSPFAIHGAFSSLRASLTESGLFAAGNQCCNVPSIASLRVGIVVVVIFERRSSSSREKSAATPTTSTTGACSFHHWHPSLHQGCPMKEACTQLSAFAPMALWRLHLSAESFDKATANDCTRTREGTAQVVRLICSRRFLRSTIFCC